MNEKDVYFKLNIILDKSFRDKEKAHIEADEALCEFLESLGYNDVVRLFRLIPKWYA